MKNYYSILEINQNATSEEIKKSYRKLALRWHPDKNSSPEAHDKFIEITEAYEVLISPPSRKAYDEILNEYLNNGETNYKSKDSEFNFEEYVKNSQSKAAKLAKLKFEEFSSILLNATKIAGKTLGKSVFSSIATYVIIGVLIYFGKSLFSDLFSSREKIPFQERPEFQTEFKSILDLSKKGDGMTVFLDGSVEITKDSIFVDFFPNDEISYLGDKYSYKIISLATEPSKPGEEKNTLFYKTNDGDFQIGFNKEGIPYSFYSGTEVFYLKPMD